MFYHKMYCPKLGETINLPYKEIPERVYDLMPNVKLVVILRNPIERAYASYQWLVDAGMEDYTFEDAIKHNVDRRSKLKEPLTENKIDELNKPISSYLLRSIYLYDIKRWAEFFPIENMIFVKSEDLFKEPLSTVNTVLEFLNLNKLDKIESENIDEKDIAISKEFRNELNEFFNPYNKKLYEYIRKDYGWD